MLNIDAFENILTHVYQNEVSLMWPMGCDLVSPTIAVSKQGEHKSGSCSVSQQVTVSACLQFTLKSQRHNTNQVMPLQNR